MSRLSRVGVCEVTDCGEPILARRLCIAHYRRQRLYGDPVGMPEPEPTEADRFWAKVDKHGPFVPGYEELGPCWQWTAQLSRGYGRFKSEHQQLAHRWVYEAEVGPLPAYEDSGLTLDHLCHNLTATCAGGHRCVHRRCVSPVHLQLIDAVENARLSPNNNARKKFCPYGHKYTPENTWITKAGGRFCRTCSLRRGRQ